MILYIKFKPGLLGNHVHLLIMLIFPHNTWANLPFKRKLYSDYNNLADINIICQPFTLSYSFVLASVFNGHIVILCAILHLFVCLIILNEPRVITLSDATSYVVKQCHVQFKILSSTSVEIM